MSDINNENELAQFNEFFSIKHQFTVNVTPIHNNPPPSYDDFVKNMPLAFKMANDIMTLDHAALRPLQTLNSIAGQLVEFLNHQTQKIDLLVGFILSQQDEERYRYLGSEFGGGGIVIKSKTPFSLGQIIELKIFLSQENCAIYCFGKIIEVFQAQEDTFYKIVFHHIREEDREVLVRASLHQQSRLLQTLAKQREQSKNNE